MSARVASPHLARVCIVGNVDDGKSTLVGRLLMATQSVRVNEINALKATNFDLAHFTDGLKCEQEGAFTLDVAYRHLQLGGQRVLLADAPGHLSKFQSALTALSQSPHVILVSDGERPLSPLLKLLVRVCVLFGTRSCVVAVTKQDRLAYQEQPFRQRETELKKLFESLDFRGALDVVPVSAVEDQNISLESPCMPWFEGPTLLDCVRQVIANAQEARVEGVSGQLLPLGNVAEGSVFVRLDRGTISVGERVRVSQQSSSALVDPSPSLEIRELSLGLRSFESVSAPFCGWVTVSPEISQATAFWLGPVETSGFADMICSCSREDLERRLQRRELWVESPWFRRALLAGDVSFDPVGDLGGAGGDDGSTPLGFLRVHFAERFEVPASLGGLSLVDQGRRQVIGVGRWTLSPLGAEKGRGEKSSRG